MDRVRAVSRAARRTREVVESELARAELALSEASGGGSANTGNNPNKYQTDLRLGRSQVAMPPRRIGPIEPDWNGELTNDCVIFADP